MGIKVLPLPASKDQESDMSIISDIISIKGGKPSDYDGLSTEELNRLRAKAFKDAEKKMSGGPVKKKKKASSGYMGGGYVKPKMMGHGGMAYRGRSYAYGGRVAKYKG